MLPLFILQARLWYTLYTKTQLSYLQYSGLNRGYFDINLEFPGQIWYLDSDFPTWVGIFQNNNNPKGNYFKKHDSVKHKLCYLVYISLKMNVFLQTQRKWTWEEAPSILYLIRIQLRNFECFRKRHGIWNVRDARKCVSNTEVSEILKGKGIIGVRALCRLNPWLRFS